VPKAIELGREPWASDEMITPVNTQFQPPETLECALGWRPRMVEALLALLGDLPEVDRIPSEKAPVSETGNQNLGNQTPEEKPRK
jgi:hypothetical protein